MASLKKILNPNRPVLVDRAIAADKRLDLRWVGLMTLYESYDGDIERLAASDKRTSKDEILAFVKHIEDLGYVVASDGEVDEVADVWTERDRPAKVDRTGAVKPPRHMPTLEPEALARKGQHVVYFHWKENELLYVGVTQDMPKRLKHHSQSSPWWTEVDRISATLCDTRGEALQIELSTMLATNPRYNSSQTAFRTDVVLHQELGR